MSRSPIPAPWLLLGGALAGAGLVLAARQAAAAPLRINLAGRVVLITGGSRGLGLVLARTLVARGARVALVARDADELDRAENDVRAWAVEHGQQGDVFSIACDVTDDGAAAFLVDAVVDHFGRLDVLINNAGRIVVGPMEEMTRQDYDDALQLHFWAPYNLVQAALPHLKRAGGGRIVNISSIGGKIAVPHLLPYTTSKFALTGFSQGLRAELLKDDVAVTTVCPALMRTGSPDHAQFKGQHRDEHAWFTLASSTPGVSLPVERAARRIVEACERGAAEVVLSAPFRAVATLHGVFPGLTATLASIVARLLPAPGGIGTQARAGKDSGSPLVPASAGHGALTTFSDRAALLNNER